MIQLAIFCTGGVAVWLSQDERESWRRFACIFGLCGQPFWLYSAWDAGQLGVFALCLWYTYAWGRGVYTNWIKK